MAFTINATLTRPYEEAVADGRTLISEHGFGVLTEIDLAATLEANLGAVEDDRRRSSKRSTPTPWLAWPETRLVWSPSTLAGD